MCTPAAPSRGEGPMRIRADEDLRAMVTRERRLDRAERLIRRALMTIGEELRESRIRAGLSQREVGRLVGLSHSHISRIESGLVRTARYDTLVRIGAVLGLDIPLRAYPNGDPVRDAAQLALIGRFRAVLPASVRWRAEVALGIPGDLRAWDGVISGPGWSMPVEAETRIRDVQALLRKLALKQRDAGADQILLLLADTRHNRSVLRLYADEFAAFPADRRAARAALASGRSPGTSCLLLA